MFPGRLPLVIILSREPAEGVDLGSVAEWTAALAAFAALGLSIFALVVASRAGKRNSLVSMQERLDAREVSEGRRIIYDAKSIQDVAKLFDKRDKKTAWDYANRTINLWNTLAQFTRLGIVNRRLSFRLWGDSVVEAWENVEYFIRFRRGAGHPAMPGRTDKWSSLVWFASKAGATVSQDLLPAEVD